MSELEALIERERIIETINTLFIATDARDWAAVRACLAPEVLFDMTSLSGGEPQRVSAQTIIDGWEQGLRPLRAVHHQSGNFRVRVDGTRAEAFCYGIAYHYLPRASGESTRTFVGSYDFQLEQEGGRWRIGAFRFNLKFITGNLELERPEEPRAASSG